MKTTWNRLTFAGLGVTALSVGLLLSNSTIFAWQGAATPEPVKRVNAEDLKWVDAPDGLGFKTAIVEGDPAKPGLHYPGEISAMGDEQTSLPSRSAIRNCDQGHVVYRRGRSFRTE